MNFDAWIPVLDALSRAMEGLPVPAVAIAGAVLAGVVLVLRKWMQAKGAAPMAEVVQMPVKQVADAPADPKANADVTNMVNSTLKP